MAEIVLYRPSVVAIVDQPRSTAIPQQVGVHGEADSGPLPARVIILRTVEADNSSLRSVTKV